MLNVSNAQKIYAHVGPVDMRRGINGLSGIVREGFGTDPTDGSLFLFMNRRRDRLKILYFCEGGFWLVVAHILLAESLVRQRAMALI